MLLVKSLRFLLIPVLAGAAVAQQAPDEPPQTQTPADVTSSPVTLSRPYEQPSNYFNFYAFANAVYDSTNPIFAPGEPQTSTGSSGWGGDFGGGFTGYHQFHQGSLAVSYRGSYRDYQTTSYPSGTDQNLSLLFQKRLSRRWTLTFSQAAGIFLYGGTYFAVQPAEANPIVLNPFSTETRFLQSSVTLSYQQTRRLSYEISGDLYITRYNTSAAYGTTGGAGSGAVLYRVTRRTTVSGTYSHTNFDYQRGGGSSSIDTVYGTLSHDFSRRWNLGISGGFSRIHASGVVTVPVSIALGGSVLTGYVTGPYNTVSIIPYVQGTVSHNWRHSQLSVTGGQTITSGNGFFLTARDLGVTGYYSYTLSRQSNIGIGGSFARLSSMANAAGSYSTGTFGASYGYNMTRHIGFNLRFDHLRYGSFVAYPGLSDNRVSFGVVFNSKNVPITLF